MFECIIDEESKNININNSHIILLKGKIYPDSLVTNLFPKYFKKVIVNITEPKVEEVVETIELEVLEKPEILNEVVINDEPQIETPKRGRKKKEEILLDNSSEVVVEID